MGIVAKIVEQAAAAGLPFLVIGGHAVNAHGYPRTTADIDLLVREDDRRAWDELIVPLGYRTYQMRRAFQMYNPIAREIPPLDLMLVDAGTFSKLASAAGTRRLDDASVQVPSLLHLIALKLHALKNGSADRRNIDLSDIATLLAVNHVDLASAEYAEIIERYATPAIAAEIRSFMAGPESAGA